MRQPLSIILACYFMICYSSEGYGSVGWALVENGNGSAFKFGQKRIGFDILVRLDPALISIRSIKKQTITVHAVETSG